MLCMNSRPRIALTIFWTLCVCAYVLGVWCTSVLIFGVQLLPFNQDYIIFGGWTKEADFTQELCQFVTLALVPFIIYFWRSPRRVCAGLGVWCFHILWFFVFAVY